MLNFAEQTGSGAVIVVWSFLLRCHGQAYLKSSSSCFKDQHTYVTNTRILLLLRVFHIPHSQPSNSHHHLFSWFGSESNRSATGDTSLALGAHLEFRDVPSLWHWHDLIYHLLSYFWREIAREEKGRSILHRRDPKAASLVRRSWCCGTHKPFR